MLQKLLLGVKAEAVLLFFGLRVLWACHAGKKGVTSILHAFVEGQTKMPVL